MSAWALRMGVLAKQQALAKAEALGRPPPRRSPVEQERIRKTAFDAALKSLGGTPDYLRGKSYKRLIEED